MVKICFGFVDQGGRLIEYLIDGLSIEVISYVVGVDDLEVFLDLVFSCIFGMGVHIECIAAVVECGLLF